MEITSAEFVISNTREKMSGRYLPRICLHRPFQRRKVKPYQYADRPQRTGNDFRYPRKDNANQPLSY